MRSERVSGNKGITGRDGGMTATERPYRDCRDCAHYKPAAHTELVPMCRRTDPPRVAFDEREGECRDGKHFAELQRSMFDD